MPDIEPKIDLSHSVTAPVMETESVYAGKSAPVVLLRDLLEAELLALRNEYGARLNALSEQLLRSESQSTTQAGTLSANVASSATVLEQRVAASASAAAGAVEQTRTAFEKILASNVESARTDMLNVRRELELRDEHYKEMLVLRDSYDIKLNILREQLIDIRFDAAKEAVLKAEVSSEKRFEGVNEFRAQLGDQQRTLMPRAEVEVVIRAQSEKLDAVAKNLSDKLDAIARDQSTIRDTRNGGVLTIAWAIGIVSIVITVIALVASHVIT